MSDPAVPFVTSATTTNGWDTVYALFFPDVNLAIANKKSSPATFNVTDGGATLSGTYGTWQLVGGGDGENLHMCLPLNTSKLVLSPTTTYQYASPINVIIEVKLNWVSPPNATPTTPQTLQVNTAKTDPTLPPVSIITIEYGTNTLDFMTKADFMALIEECLLNSLADFQHVFSTITLNTILAKDPAGNDLTGFQWTVPTTTLYAIVDQADSKDAEDFNKSIFAVLCMTGGRTGPGVHEIDPYAIPACSNSSFLISGARLLEEMLLPGLLIMFKDSPTASNFDVTATTITNNVDLTFTDQQLDNGNVVNPAVSKGNFVIQLVDKNIQFTMNGLSFEYSHGVTISINHTSMATLSLTTDRKFKMDMGNSTTSATVSLSKDMQWGLIGASIAAAVVGAAVGGFAGGLASGGAAGAVDAAGNAAIEAVEVSVADSAEDAVTNVSAEAASDAAGQAGGLTGKFANFFAANWAKMLGSFIGGAVGGGATAPIATILQKVASDHGSEIPTLDLFGTQMMAPITWPDMAVDGDLLQGGGLGGGTLQIGLNLKSNVTAS